MQAEGIIKELVLLDGKPCARIQCDHSLIPAPGQYLLADAGVSDLPPALRSSALAASVFSAKSFTDGFLAAPPIPASWNPGMRLHLRGPLGHGFVLAKDARRVALIAFDTQPASASESPIRLLALLDTVLKQEVSIVLVCKTPPDDLPLQIEVQPLNALMDICNWADYIAMDVARESLPELKKILGMRSPLIVKNGAQILIRTPMPCGALAECGVCTIESRRGQLQVCKDGPVFDLKDLLD
jgi:Iron-sulfur cluster binding domain of dihydroorotate dehydrogenase B